MADNLLSPLVSSSFEKNEPQIVLESDQMINCFNNFKDYIDDLFLLRKFGVRSAILITL